MLQIDTVSSRKCCDYTSIASGEYSPSLYVCMNKDVLYINNIDVDFITLYDINKHV